MKRKIEDTDLMFDYMPKLSDPNTKLNSLV